MDWGGTDSGFAPTWYVAFFPNPLEAPPHHRSTRSCVMCQTQPPCHQEIVKTTTHQHTLGFSTTQREVVTSSAGGRRGSAKGEGGRQRAKIVDRRAKIGFHNGHTLVLPHEVSTGWRRQTRLQDDSNIYVHKEKEFFRAQATLSEAMNWLSLRPCEFHAERWGV